MRRQRSRIASILGVQLAAGLAVALIGVLVWRLSSTDRPSSAFFIGWGLAVVLLLALLAPVAIHRGRSRRQRPDHPE